MYDIVIIGAGPAGLTAALYARRMGKTVLVLEKSTFGGQVTFSARIENFPGSQTISGNDLADALVGQALSQGADIELETVTGIRDCGSYKTVLTEDGSFDCRSVIIAVGVRHRPLGVPGEGEFIGNGISFCAFCDGAFYKDKRVAVIGGGNSALSEALFLADICREVVIVQNLPHLTGEQKLADTLAARGNVSYIMSAVVAGVTGGGELTGLTLRREPGGETFLLGVDGVFVAIGLEPANEIFKDLAKLDARGYIDSGEDCRTFTPGVFAAGDCRAKDVRQITTAAADGTVAALAACRYLDTL